MISVVLADFIPDEERVLVIEDTAEIQIDAIDSVWATIVDIMPKQGCG